MKSFITVHATMTAAELSLTPRDVDRHDRAEGYSKCGYHFVLSRDGEVKQYRSDTEASIHDDREARESVSLCLVGGADSQGAPEDNFTLPQWEAVRNIATALRQTHPITNVRSKTPAVTSERVNRIIEGQP